VRCDPDLDPALMAPTISNAHQITTGPPAQAAVGGLRPNRPNDVGFGLRTRLGIGSSTKEEM
jgi:hypothetical protein